jgi:uncharacterized protein
MMVESILMASIYVNRLVDGWISELLIDSPALFLMGPRSCGKTTTAIRHSKTVLRLDQTGVRNAVAGDPDAVLGDGEPPVLVDEWQLEPSSLGAAKRLLDANDAPAQFIFAGSASDDVGGMSWPATGRFIRVPMWGLTQKELQGSSLSATFFDTVADPDFGGRFSLPKLRPDSNGYVELALMSGFPQCYQRVSERSRTAWLNSYVDHLVGRDVELIGEVREPLLFRRYLKAIAANTAGSPHLKTLIDSVGLNRQTATRYDMFLERLFASEQVPSWSSNRLTRVSGHSKRYICDAAIAATLVGADRRTVLRDADLLGRIIDTFVASQIRPELALGNQPVDMYHLRQDGRREIDLILERRDGAVVAIEVKAANSADPKDARHLIWLRDQLPPTEFRIGIVLYTGSHVLQLSERIWAVPICALWG